MKKHTPTTQYHTVITHKRPHRDEVVAFVILLCYGNTKYPGVADAIKKLNFEFWDAGTTTPDGRSAEEWENDGYILIGVGGSRFDEHILPEENEECAATLVAKDLKVQDRPELEQILRLTLTADSKGTNDPMGYDAFLRLGNKKYFGNGADFEKSMMQWAMQPIHWMLEEQYDFFSKTKEEYEKWAVISKAEYLGKEITIVSVESNDERIAQYAMSKYGATADVVIVKNERKHVYITTKTTSVICLDNVMKKIRVEELMKKDVKFNLSDPALYGKDAYPGTEHWHYQRNARRIMNGSLTATEKPATTIPLKRIVELVMCGLKTTKPRQVMEVVPKKQHRA